MTLEFVDSYLNAKIAENREIIKFSFYEVRMIRRRFYNILKFNITKVNEYRLFSIQNRRRIYV